MPFSAARNWKNFFCATRNSDSVEESHTFLLYQLLKWLLTIPFATSSMGEITPDGFVLENPSLQVFEPKPKEDSETPGSSETATETAKTQTQQTAAKKANPFERPSVAKTPAQEGKTGAVSSQMR